MSETREVKAREDKVREALERLRFRISRELLRTSEVISFQEILAESLRQSVKELRLSKPPELKISLREEIKEFKRGELEASIELKSSLSRLSPSESYALGPSEIFTRLRLKYLQVIVKLAELKPSQVPPSLSDPQLKKLRSFTLSDVYVSPFTSPPSDLPSGPWLKDFPVRAYVLWKAGGTPQLTLKKFMQVGYGRAFLRLRAKLESSEERTLRFSYAVSYYLVLFPGRLGVEGDPKGKDLSLVLRSGDLAVKVSGRYVVLHLSSSEELMATLKAELNEVSRANLTGGLVLRF